MDEQRDDDRADYKTVEFIHAIAGLPKPPPREEIPDTDAYAKEVIEGLMRGYGVL